MVCSRMLVVFMVCARSEPCVSPARVRLSACQVRDFRRKGFEVVWVSGSKHEAGFEDYLASMPWPAVPFGGTASVAVCDTKPR